MPVIGAGLGDPSTAHHLGRPRKGLAPGANYGGGVLLETISCPADLKELGPQQLAQLAEEIRDFIVRSVAVTGGHLGSNLGVVELTLAIHRVFDSPRDVILWDTGHQAYVHKIVTGRQAGFAQLRQAGRPVRIPQPSRVRARLGREQPRLDHPLLRPRHGRGSRVGGDATAGSWP